MYLKMYFLGGNEIIPPINMNLIQNIFMRNIVTNYEHMPAMFATLTVFLCNPLSHIF